MNDTLTNNRGRIRCIGESGSWRDCGQWATRWDYGWAHWLNDMVRVPHCQFHAWIDQ